MSQWQEEWIQKTERELFLLWITGISGAGKSTAAARVSETLFNFKVSNFVLDGDDLRQGLNSDLGFSFSDRAEATRRTGEVASILMKAGINVIVSAISPSRAARDDVKIKIGLGSFIEIHLDISVQMAAMRDVKGLYAAAKNGELPDLSGLNSPYEPPLNPSLHIKTSTVGEELTAQRITEYLRKDGWIADNRNTANAE